MADTQSTPNRPPVKSEGKYAGLDVPASEKPGSNDPNVTIEGGAFWVNGELRNANGELLTPEKIAEFKDLCDSRKAK